MTTSRQSLARIENHPATPTPISAAMIPTLKDGPRMDETWLPSMKAGVANAFMAKQQSVNRSSPSGFIVESAMVFASPNDRTQPHRADGVTRESGTERATRRCLESAGSAARSV